MLEFNATFIISLISFIIFIVIMNAIFYRPILNVINEREKYINERYDDAKNSKNKAQGLLEQKEKRLSQTVSEAKKIVSETVAEANTEAKNKTDAVKIKCAQNIQSKKNNLRTQEYETVKVLKQNIKDLAENISSKILGENYKIENIDEEFINKVLK